jgi:hypothetical protein
MLLQGDLQNCPHVSDVGNESDFTCLTMLRCLGQQMGIMLPTRDPRNVQSEVLFFLEIGMEAFVSISSSSSSSSLCESVSLSHSAIDNSELVCRMP